MRWSYIRKCLWYLRHCSSKQTHYHTWKSEAPHWLPTAEVPVSEEQTSLESMEECWWAIEDPRYEAKKCVKKDIQTTCQAHSERTVPWKDQLFKEKNRCQLKALKWVECYEQENCKMKGCDVISGYIQLLLVICFRVWLNVSGPSRWILYCAS